MIQNVLNYSIRLHLIGCDTDLQNNIQRSTVHTTDHHIPTQITPQNLHICVIQNPTEEQLSQLQKHPQHLSKTIVVYTSDIDAIQKKKEFNLSLFSILTAPVQSVEINQIINRALVHLYTHNEFLTLNKYSKFDTIHKILIVDDEIELSSNLAELIAPHYRTYQANTGQEAISLVEKIPNLDIVLLDVHLPDYNANQICQMIHTTSRHIKIICMSGDPLMTKSLNEQSITNIEAFLAKPFIYQELLHLLKKTIVHHTMQQSINLSILAGLMPQQNLIHLSGRREYESI